MSNIGRYNEINNFVGSKLCFNQTSFFNMSLTTWHFRNRQMICTVHVGNTNVEHEQMKIVQYLE